jgi:hypothetical protein
MTIDGKMEPQPKAPGEGEAVQLAHGGKPLQIIQGTLRTHSDKVKADNLRLAYRVMIEAREAMMLDSDSHEFMTLLGPLSRDVMLKLLGRRAVVVIEGPDGRYRAGRGRIIELDWAGNGTAHLMDEAGERHPAKLEDIRRFAVEDTSPVSRADFRLAAQGRGDLGWEARLKLDLVDKSGLVGRWASFLVRDQALAQWKKVEGRIVHYPTEGDPILRVEKDDQTVVPLRFRDVTEWFVEDTSPVRPEQLESRAKREGLRLFVTMEDGKLSRSALDGLVGLRGIAMRADKATHRWEVVEGDIDRALEADPKTARIALVGSEWRRELELDEIEMLFVSGTDRSAR